MVWITKRIFVGGGPPPHMLIVACNAPTCNVGATGSAKAVAPRTARRPALVAAKAGDTKQVVVGKGSLKLRKGQKKPLAFRFNKVGRALLEKQGKLDVKVKVTIKSAGAPTVTAKRTVHFVLKSKPKKKH